MKNKAIITIDANNIVLSEDGHYYCNNAIYGQDFWQRYLRIFSEITVITRVEKNSNNNRTYNNRVDCEGVKIHAIPFARSMSGYIRSYFQIRVSIKEAINSAEIIIIRLPSVIGFITYRLAKKRKKIVGIEVVADPFYAYYTNKIARILYKYKLKSVCKSANGVSYVTEHYLQKFYPSCISKEESNEMRFESFYSSINLNEDFFSIPRNYDNKTSFSLIHTANSMNNLDKGQDVVIKVVKGLHDLGFKIRLTLIGDGRAKNDFVDLAKSLEINEYVNFVGKLSSKYEIRRYLLASDIFIFPSKAEGLPRSLIEAMAVGLPCVASGVGGIPELLDEISIVRTNNHLEYLDRLIHLFDNPSLLNIQSKRNLQVALNYTEDILNKKRDKFYTRLLELALLNQ